MDPRRSRNMVVLCGIVVVLSARVLPVASATCRSCRLAFATRPRITTTLSQSSSLVVPAGKLFSEPPSSSWDSGSQDSNQWSSMDDEGSTTYSDGSEDWQEMLAKRQDGSFWASGQDEDDAESSSSETKSITEEEEADVWLDTLASLSADEIEFNLKEADRADKVRQMEEWGFEPETISSTLGVATDQSLEVDEVEGMDTYRQDTYVLEEDVDLTTVESHTLVPKDPETDEPIRSKMVYVDEHTCIGCYNCANIAQSTFFIDQEHGRARVFSQWGDDDETIQIAIETCPVDCIHYVPYDELVRLEVERRDQNINFKARLVSQGEYSGASISHKVGSANAFTGPQKISGNMKTRCNNCPTRGCKDCPMYGVGQNPEYERKEKERMAKIAQQRLKAARESQEKSVDL